MKIIGIGDLHGNPIWKKIFEKEKDTTDKFVFVGDYFDSYNYTTEQQVNNFLDLIELKKNFGDKIILLTGNHDLHYITGDTGTSGFQQIGSFYIRPVIELHKDKLQMMFQYENLLFSHGGISEDWLALNKRYSEGVDLNFINELFAYKPNSFIFNGENTWGNDVYQTPVWIRPAALKKSCFKNFRKKFIQIIGHTQQNKIDIKGKSTGGRYYLIDTINSNQEYLIFQNGQFSSGSVKEIVKKVV